MACWVTVTGEGKAQIGFGWQRQRQLKISSSGIWWHGSVRHVT